MEYQKTYGKSNISTLHYEGTTSMVPVLMKYNQYLRFHVDDLSSAHVYLRLRKDQRLEDVTDSTVMECAQLVKANSIEGCKLKEVHVVYTRW